jgi:dTDP-4-dehydrorhamnose reductase
MNTKIKKKNKYKYPKILLTGGTGQLGVELKKVLHFLGEVWAPNRKHFNLAEPETLRKKIKNYEPDLIINTAAYTAVDQAELNLELASYVNKDSPKVLAEEAFYLEIPFIHYSTDYVFEGHKKIPYVESDETNPINVYGKTKLEGEYEIQKKHNQYLIFRTSWLFGTHGKNFYTTMLKLFKEKEIVNVVCDQVGSPTSVKFLAKATIEILSQLKKNDKENRWGVYHLTGEEKMTWYDFAKKIYKKEKKMNKFKTKKILPISCKKYFTEALRPNFSALNCSLIQQKFKNIY